MLQILRRPCITPRSKVLKEDVCASVQPDHERLGKFSRRHVSLATAYNLPRGLHVPRPTEIITSFCLVAGGITFIVSNKDTVAALESYGLDAMFTFTVTMGLTALLLAWTTVVIAIKGWALRVEGRSQYSKGRAGVLA